MINNHKQKYFRGKEEGYCGVCGEADQILQWVISSSDDPYDWWCFLCEEHFKLVETFIHSLQK